MEYGPVKVVGREAAPLTPEESLRQAARLRRLWKKACAAQGSIRPRGVVIKGRTWEEADAKLKELLSRGE
jgi:hypothetical protein